MSAASFSRQIDLALAGIEKQDFLGFKQKIAMQSLTGITNKMPVDTGRARGNTIASIGRTDISASETTDTSGGTVIANGANVIFGDNDPYAAVYIQNNLPYINRLEDGYSGQAPSGMMALTIAEIETQFK